MSHPTKQDLCALHILQRLHLVGLDCDWRNLFLERNPPPKCGKTEPWYQVQLRSYTISEVRYVGRQLTEVIVPWRIDGMPMTNALSGRKRTSLERIAGLGDPVLGVAAAKAAEGIL